MATHVKVIGWSYIILGIFGFLSALALGVLISAGGWISGDQTAITVLTIISIIVGGLVVGISIPGIITGVGLLANKGWARVLAIILGILNLPAFPVGTILGVYTLYIMLDSETSRLFN